ncbi:MAG: hypothetical protein RQ897_14670 [Thermoflexus sp.]|jgi:hypothetical protein|nr:hypothetical protein [Thermoflexus sp.]MDT7949577.1 hypothetical protein [Thermoflexus sp.]
MDTVLRVHPEQIRGQIRRLRAWGEAWRAQVEASRRVAMTLSRVHTVIGGMGS